MSTYIISYFAASAVFAFVLWTARRYSGEAIKPQTDLKSLDARLAEIDKKVRGGELSDAEASTSRLELMRGALESNGQHGGTILPFRRTPLIAASVLGAAAGLIVTNLTGGMPASAPGELPGVFGAASAAGEDEVLARLRDYAQSSTPALPARITGPMSVPGEETQPSLPDVDTMIERLADRLEQQPDDAEGWRMLGWSYVNTSRFAEAEAAYARAAALKPDSTEIKLAYEEAKSKASAGQPAPDDPKLGFAEVPAAAATAPSTADVAAAEALPAKERNDMIKSMVDRLASRLETSPRDAEGWIKLIRSQTVLGEKDAAVAALRTALEVFKNEPEQLTSIAAAANDLGVISE